MPAWQGKRTITVVTACVSAAGTPDFALNTVELTHDEYENGIHYDRVEEQLADAGYDEPFVHFDEQDAPALLHPAVRAYLGLPAEPIAWPSMPPRRLRMPRIIEVTVSPKGEVTIETKGYAGAECLKASKFLEQALGVPSADSRTPEFYQAQSTEQHLRQ